jgi:ABC-type dipeptide/oligopeptide/nickel transport system permease component
MDFITTARAKGLRMRWIVAVHALPHVRSCGTHCGQAASLL